MEIRAQEKRFNVYNNLLQQDLHNTLHKIQYVSPENGMKAPLNTKLDAELSEVRPCSFAPRQNTQGLRISLAEIA